MGIGLILDRAPIWSLDQGQAPTARQAETF